MTALPLRWRMVATGALALALIGLAARPCQANGFLIYDISGDALGRASAVTAAISEPAAIWFNPAALSFMKGVNASVGGTFITARSRFSPTGGGPDTDSERGNFVLPAVFASAPVSDRVALGMGVYTTFGIGIRWPDDWAGSQNAIAASLETLAFNPTVAVKVSRRFSLAAGFDAIRGAVDFTTGLPAIVGGDVRLVGGAWGYGFNVGALYRPLPQRVQVALTYRSRVALHFDDGQADFRPAHVEFERQLPDQGGNAAITLPDMITAGVMVRPIEPLTLTFDANLVFWTTYQTIQINFQHAPARVLQPDGHDSYMLRLGADLAPPRVPGLHFRMGLIFDRSAVRAEGLGPGLPDANRLDGALGVGYGRGHLRADLGYLLVYFLPADAVGGRESPEGTYRTLAHLLGLTVAASWR
ncbi:MAG TPA: outer membrane protein transport protein [Polyangia bacterium]|nr:outer membrane protein transport protein [Polyangia bacterium]